MTLIEKAQQKCNEATEIIKTCNTLNFVRLKLTINQLYSAIKHEQFLSIIEGTEELDRLIYEIKENEK